MNKQIIDFNDVDNMVFDGNEVAALILNDLLIWEKSIPGFNYTGLDANGNMEGSRDFDGTIVAYAIGKPTITMTDTTDPTTGEVTQTENITYNPCNGYSDEYYNYDFQTSMTTSSTDYVVPDERVIDETLIIPDTYKGKPVTTILNAAFRASFSNAYDMSQPTEYYQSCFLKSIILGNNIVKIGMNAFYGVGYYFRDGNRYASVFETIDLKNIQAIGDSALSYINGGGFSFDLPNTVNEVNAYAFSHADEVRVNSDITKFSSNGAVVGTNGVYIWSGIDVVIFSNNVTSVPISLLSADQVLVFEQPDGVDVTITADEQKSATAITIYTDNNSIKNFNWSNYNYTPTFHSLSEFQG